MWNHVTPSDITNTLCLKVRFLGPTTVFLPKDISTRFIFAFDVMDLLNARVDGDIIYLIRRWLSDAMLLYLHVHTAPAMKMFASLVVFHSKYNLHATMRSHGLVFRQLTSY